MPELVPVFSEKKSLLSFPEGLAGEAQKIDLKNLMDSVAPSTRRVYSLWLRKFSAWCQEKNLLAFPASTETLLLYLDHIETSGASVSAISQNLAAIRMGHELLKQPFAGDTPEIRRARRAIRRRIGITPAKKAAATSDIVRLLIESIDSDYRASDLKKIRDRALILTGFAGAFRRSELVSLKMTDLEETLGPDGRRVILIHVRRSKTDPEGRGMTKAIFEKADRAMCPVTALKRWFLAAGISMTEDGPVFREVRRGGHVTDKGISAQIIALTVQHYAELAGLSLDVAGHSLRRGFVTEALKRGATERSVMNQTGHRSVTVMREYIERRDAVSDNAAALL